MRMVGLTTHIFLSYELGIKKNETFLDDLSNLKEAKLSLEQSKISVHMEEGDGLNLEEYEKKPSNYLIIGEELIALRYYQAPCQPEHKRIETI